MARKQKVKRSKQPRKKTITRKFAQKIVTKAAETKFVNQAADYTFGSVGTTRAELNISEMPAQGDTASSRDGDLVFLKNFTLKGILEPGDTTNLVRFAIIKCDDDLDTSSFDLETDINSLVSEGVMHVYVDKYLYLDQTAGPSKKVINMSIPLNTRQHYNSSNAKYSSIRMIMVSDSGAVSHPGFATDCGFIRLTFKDL